MIALIGDRRDRALRAVFKYLRRRPVSTVYVDATDSIAVRRFLDLAVDRQRRDRVRAVYVRLPAPTSSGEGAVSDLQSWLEVSTARVITRPSIASSGASKPLQLQQIARVGFSIPATVITNDPNDVQTFRTRYRQIIYKSVSGVRSIVRLFEPRAEARLDRIRLCPTMFQEYVPGVDYRVHVIGERVISSRIVSPTVDYRYATREGFQADIQPGRLPPSVAARCRNVARSLNLEFAGIDLRKRSDGSFVCFEVNPSPGFVFFDPNGARGIARAVADLLMAP